MKRKGGLQPTPVDDRDFVLGAITTLPDLRELPKEYILEGFDVKDQRGTDFCTAFMTCGMSELQEGVRLSPEWSFAASKELSGDPDAWGQNIRTAMAVHVKKGAVEASDVPFTVETHGDSFLRRISNYPNLFKKAIKHLKQSYVRVEGQYDHFDDIRATIWKYRNEKRAVGSGFVFGWNSRDQIFDTIPKNGEGHAMYFVGWKTINRKPYLAVVNSYGKRAGDNGVHYLSREVVNHFVDRYGAYMFMDMDPKTLKYMIDNGITDRDSWLMGLMKTALTLMQDLLSLKKNEMKTLLDHAKEAIGKDITPDDLIPDTVSCAIQLTTLINKVDATFPKVAGTWTLYDILEHRKDYERVTDPTPGTLIVSPTGMGKRGTNGHTGVFLDDGYIASNDSATGTFKRNYTLASWTERYKNTLKYPIFMYRKKGGL